MLAFRCVHGIVQPSPVSTKDTVDAPTLGGASMAETDKSPSLVAEKKFKVICRICSHWFRVASEKKPQHVPEHPANKFSGSAKCLGGELSPGEVRAL